MSWAETYHILDNEAAWDFSDNLRQPNWDVGVQLLRGPKAMPCSWRCRRTDWRRGAADVAMRVMTAMASGYGRACRAQDAPSRLSNAGSVQLSNVNDIATAESVNRPNSTKPPKHRRSRYRLVVVAVTKSPLSVSVT